MRRKVREQAGKLTIVTNGLRYSPGAVHGYSHANNMTSHTLKHGDSVRCRVIVSSPLVELTCDDGTVLVWHVVR